MFWMQWYLSPGVGGLLIWSRALDWGCRDKTQDPPGTRRLAKARQVLESQENGLRFMGAVAHLC